MSSSAANELPIDIKDTKLCDWLVDRRWTTLENRDQAVEIRKHINDAIRDMPDVDEITEMLAGSYITYYHCKRIVELLKVSEADSRSFFGSYSSKRMKDWLEILTMYEKDHIYLGESARILQHNVEYEIPSLKRKLSAAQTRINDSHRRETELRAKAQTTQEDFVVTCQKMGIAGGDNIQEELQQLPMLLPHELEKVTALVQSDAFKSALAHYTAFVDFTMDEIPKDDETEVLFKILRFVTEQGNTSCFEYETGQPLPELSEPSAAPQPTAADSADVDAGGEIDFGDGGEIDFGDGGGEIDFGDGDGSGAIDFGDSVDGAASDGDSGKSGTEGWVEVSDPGAIDFGDVDTVDLGIQVADFGMEVGVTEDVETEGPTAAAREPLLINTTTRNKIVDQIIQLESFLLQRADELSQDIDITSINQFEGAKAGVVQSKPAVVAMLAPVMEALALLQGKRIQQLFLIRGSAKYVDRLASSLRQQKFQSMTILGRIERLDEQRTASQTLMEECAPKIAGLIKQTKVLQRNVESSISGLYKGRAVNVIGDINNL
eukprot:m.394450 g.394450  ORF g.394450 m.394450 type:complete len:547 (+) comp28344_c1_seq1:77-1717(+)